jgi:hypothetical protein
MKISVGSRRQLALLAVLAGLLVLALVRSGRDETPAPARRPASAPAPGVEGDEPAASRSRGRSDTKKVTADDLPYFNRKDLDSVDASASTVFRNIFDFRPPTPTPMPTQLPTPTPAPVCGDPRFLGPCAPPPPPTSTPTPTPPEITFKFIGSFGPKEQPIAVLVAGDKVINARTGDVVLERFIIKKVGYESIDVGFVGPWSDVRRLPIAP